MSKDRNDVKNMFVQVLAGRSHKLHPERDKATINKWIDFLNSFGSAVAYDVLWEYAYDDDSSEFFNWPKVISRLKLKLAEQYLDEDKAWEEFINLVVRKGFLRPPEPKDISPELAQFINENGGWVTLCDYDTERLEKLFMRKYKKIINSKVSKQIMEKNESN